MTNYTELIERLEADCINRDRRETTGSIYAHEGSRKDLIDAIEALVAERDAMENRYTRLKVMVDDGSINGRMWSAGIESERQIVALEAERDALRAELDAIKSQDRVRECAQRLVEHADFRLGGILSEDSKARDIPSRAVSHVKSRHLAALRDALASPQPAQQEIDLTPRTPEQKAAALKWLDDLKAQTAQQEPTECTCSAKEMRFLRCCKAPPRNERERFERWYDAQQDGRIQPWDVWQAAVKEALHEQR
jgi:AcrR family transcriptional regulator